MATNPISTVQTCKTVYYGDYPILYKLIILLWKSHVYIKIQSWHLILITNIMNIYNNSYLHDCISWQLYWPNG